MNVDLAFTPNTHFDKRQDFGALGTQFPNELSIEVPPTFFKRIVYLQFATDPETLAFLVNGRLKFTLAGQITGEVPLALSLSSNGAFMFGDGFAEDGIVAWVGATPIRLDMPPNEFICACDAVTWQTDAQTVIPGTHQPCWFFGVKSMHHW